MTSLQPFPLPLTPALVRPGGWRLRARHALARLALCGTLDDVVREFGSARDLTEAVFGLPMSGGHSTKPMVKVVGRLLQHRLGAAPAAEALTLASEVQHLVTTHTLITILEQYVEVTTAAGLPGETELSALVDAVEAAPSRRRHRVAVEHTHPQRSWIAEQLWSIDHGADVSHPHVWHHHAASETIGEIFPVSEWWLDDVDDPVPSTVAGCARLSPGECALAARTLLLGEQVADPRFVFLTEHLAVSEWQQLLEQVQHPSDHRRALIGMVRLDAPTSRLIALLSMLPSPVGEGHGRRRWVARSLVGRLTRHHDRRVRVAVAAHTMVGDLGVAATERVLGAIRVTGEEWLLRAAARSEVPLIAAAAVDGLSRIGVRIGCHEIRPAFAVLAPLLQTTTPADALEVQSHVASLPASQRQRVAFHHHTDRGSTVPYRHPTELRRLDGRTLPGHEEWTLRLPRHDRELFRNADRMGNCSGDYCWFIAAGDCMLAMIDGPDDVTCNVEFRLEDGAWTVGDLLGRFNRPAPEWMRASVEHLLSGRRRRLVCVA